MTEKEFWDSIGSVYEAEKVSCLDCIVTTYSGRCSSYATCGDAIRALFYLHVEDKVCQNGNLLKG